jgi:hypothetical protein
MEYFDVLATYKADNGNYIFYPLPVATIVQWDCIEWKFAGHIQPSRDDHALMSGLYLLPNECERVDFSPREFALRKQMQNTHVGFLASSRQCGWGRCVEIRNNPDTHSVLYGCRSGLGRATSLKRGGHVW